MPTEKEITIVQKATIYDLEEVFGVNSGENKTYTAEEIGQLLRAYIKGKEQ